MLCVLIFSKLVVHSDAGYGAASVLNFIKTGLLWSCCQSKGELDLDTGIAFLRACKFDLNHDKFKKKIP